MRTYKPGMTYYNQFCTQDQSGAATDADSLPAATASKNCVDDAAFVLAVAKMDTGRYSIIGTVPLSYVTDDVVEIVVNASVGGVSGKNIISDFIVEEDSGANAVTITVEQADATPIPDVSIIILNTAETVKLKSGITDANGQLTVSLNDGAYKMRLSKSMVNFVVPETLTVSGATLKTCVGSPVSPTAPAAGLQTLIIYPTDIGLTYTSGAKITAKAAASNSSVDTAVLTDEVTVAEDKTTHFEMQIAKGATVRITAKVRTTKFIDKEITISQSDTAYLANYL
jgi:hypothetical protein